MSRFPRAAKRLNGFAVAAGTAAKRLPEREVPPIGDYMHAGVEPNVGLCAWSRMKKASEYRLHAKECRDLAATMGSPAQKGAALY